jgi:uncharacterized cupredoxin-like copper-binding protein
MRRFPGLIAILLGLLSLGTFAGAVAPLSGEEKAPTPAGAVEVRLSEYKIQIPSTLPAGPTTFALHNDGNKKHAFKLEGPGMTDGTQSAILDPQQSGELQVTLQPGEYKVYCPIGSHSIKGMSLTLTVTAKPAG